MRAARELAAPLVQGERRPLVFEEKRPKVGRGDKAFKSLTAAVRAAEREKEEARGFKLAAEAVLVEAEGVLKRAHVRVEEMRCFVRRWCLVFVVLLLLNAVCGLWGIVVWLL